MDSSGQVTPEDGSSSRAAEHQVMQPEKTHSIVTTDIVDSKQKTKPCNHRPGSHAVAKPQLYHGVVGHIVRERKPDFRIGRSFFFGVLKNPHARLTL